jgi:hypothetical protein
LIRKKKKERERKTKDTFDYTVCFNPSHEFIKIGSKIDSLLKKYNVKSWPFDGSDILIPLIVEASSRIILTNYQGWIRHSISFFDRSLSFFLEKKAFDASKIIIMFSQLASIIFLILEVLKG